MELPDIGKHCQYQHCEKLDFLPVGCPHCNGIFCGNHVAIDQHQCPHHSNRLVSSLSKSTSGQNNQKCHLLNCNEQVLLSDDKQSAIVGYKCGQCSRMFCVKHRHPIDHKCDNPSTSTQTISTHKLNAIESVRNTTPPTRIATQPIRKRKFNPKVELMKMKMKATGEPGIPPSSRLYLRVFTQQSNSPIFVDKEWTLGKVLDKVADHMCMPNRNNSLVSKDDPDRLTLFDASTGTEINSSMMSNKVTDVIENGSFVILERMGNSSKLDDDESAPYSVNLNRYTFP